MSAAEEGVGRRVKGRVLLVDDEAYVRDSLADVLERRGFLVTTASGVEEALGDDALAGADAVVTDLRMPGADGLELLRRLRELHPSLPVVVLTAHGSVPSAVECMREGAFDYLTKPASADELSLVLERSLASSSMRRELEYLRSPPSPGVAPDQRPIGAGPAWSRVIELAERAAPSDTPVLLLGETGTGKERVARHLHRRSRRADGPFVSVNCGAIPAELFESEFFGHRRGAFTGAVRDRDGRFKVAHGGTLFLDEINSLPPAAQAKVLRVLEDGTFERVGDSRPTTVDVRILSASNADLEEEAARGGFRSDLLYRINVLTIRLPPLRERREDVAELAGAFLEEACGRLGKRLEGIADETLARLEAYDWPGNVRELRNVIERGVLLETGSELTPDHLMLGGEAGARGEAEPTTLRERIAAAEREALVDALRASRGVRKAAAERLGVDARNLAYYLKKHELMDWEPR